MLDYLGDLGGLLDILLLFGASMTGFVTHKLWVGSMIRQFYTIQKYFMDVTELDEVALQRGGLEQQQSHVSGVKSNDKQSTAEGGPKKVASGPVGRIPRGGSVHMKRLQEMRLS